MERKMTKPIQVGKYILGGKNPVRIQTMLNLPAGDVPGNVRQAVKMEEAGCEILRVAIPTLEDVRLIQAIRSEITIPLVADIHFDYRIALKAVEAGVDKIRINPGNIGSKEKVEAVAKACKEAGIPIRIGVNSGSLFSEILKKHGGPTVDAICESGLEHARMLEEFDFDQILLSLKSSDVPTTVACYRKISQMTDYPLHLGVTEAGTLFGGVVKSAMGIGGLLLEGIGDTIRVSLTDDPIQEIRTAKEILKGLGLRQFGAKLVSCPTCGRTQIDLVGLAGEIEKMLDSVKAPITVAVMGCAVNGPGEAKEADLGVAGGKGEGLIFSKGEVLYKVPEEQLLSAFETELKQYLATNGFEQ